MSMGIQSFDNLHDNIVLRCCADFEAHTLRMDTRTEAGENVSVHFTGLLAHWFENVIQDNWCKFSQNRDLREFLLSTGDSVLVEASPYDNIWGIRLAASSQEAQDPTQWRGQNLLGFALMEVRDELRRVTQNEMLCD